MRLRRRSPSPSVPARRLPLVGLLLLALTTTSAAACAVTPAGAGTAALAPLPAAQTSPAAELRLGYFATITHATAVYGVASGGYARALGATRLRTQVFSAGPAAVEALFAGSLDAAYLGPNPAVNAFVKSGGAVRVVAGAASGGASLVVAPDVRGPADLRGRVLASPQTGGTQDVALRTWLAGQGLRTDLRGAGDVTVRAQDNAQTLTEFQAGRVAGAWVPEPWASRLVLQGGGHVLVDERTLWPGGRFATTLLVVRSAYLREHPQTVTALLQAQVGADRALHADPVQARAVVGQALGRLTGKPLPPAVLARAFTQVTPTEDPLASSLRTVAAHGAATGLVPAADLTGIEDLRLLRMVLGRPVDDAGLGAVTPAGADPAGPPPAGGPPATPAPSATPEKS